MRGSGLGRRARSRPDSSVDGPVERKLRRAADRATIAQRPDLTCIHLPIRANDVTMPANPATPAKPRAKRKSRYEGIVLRHTRACGIRQGGRCSCTPAYQAQVWSARDRKTIRKTFPSLGEARAWRQESQLALRKGTLRAASLTTLDEAAQQWLAAAEAGLVRTRSGDAYKPSAVRAYRQALRHRVLPTFGTRRFTAVSQAMLQDLADQLAVQGLSASSIRNTILPLRAIYRRALNRGEVALDPTRNLPARRPHQP